MRSPPSTARTLSVPLSLVRRLVVATIAGRPSPIVGDLNILDRDIRRFFVPLFTTTDTIQRVQLLESSLKTTNGMKEASCRRHPLTKRRREQRLTYRGCSTRKNLLSSKGMLLPVLPVLIDETTPTLPAHTTIPQS